MTDDSTDNTSPEPGSGSKKSGARRILREICAVYGLALLLILGLVLLGQSIGFVANNLYLLVAAVFVGIPYALLRHKDANFDNFGLTWTNAGRRALWGLLFTALTLGPFCAGYWWWQTEILGNEFHYSVDHFYAWPVDYQGHPAGWDKATTASGEAQASGGVWVWTERGDVHLGIKTGKHPVEALLESGDALTVDALTQAGPARALIGSADKYESEQTAHRTGLLVRLEQTHSHAEIILRDRPNRQTPREIHVSIVGQRTGPQTPVYRGPTDNEGHADANLSRGLSWIFLWLMTQLIFIALPEEFFYRGYLLTRIADFLALRGNQRADNHGADNPTHESSAIKNRRFLGISAQNALTSLLFALGHLLIPVGGVLLISRASVFFPALAFGWLRERTDSIAAPVVYHAAANMMVLLAAPHFF